MPDPLVNVIAQAVDEWHSRRLGCDAVPVTLEAFVAAAVRDFQAMKENDDA